jgi:SNF2 family DNA or RNA helicase
MAFSTTTELMPHQLPAVAKLLPARVGGLFMDMGLGKSRVLIELAALRQGKWDRWFWIAPVSLKETVRQELLKHTDLRPEQIHVFDERTGTRALPPALVYVIGIETLSASDRAVLAFAALITESSFVAVDESAYIKGHRAKRTQRVTNIAARARYRAVLTGTPFTQGAVDLYAQMKFLSPKILGYASFWSFANNHLEFETKRGPGGRRVRTGRILRSHNSAYLAARVAPYVYQVRKEECLQLPEKLHVYRWCSMTGEQRYRYEQAKREILLEMDYDDWSAVRIFHLFSTLQGIVCGFWNRTDPLTGRQELLRIPHRRIELLEAAIDEIPDGEPVIIWAKYHHCIEEIGAFLTEAYGSGQVAQFHGHLSERRRHAELDRWRSGARFLVATQAAGGHGLTLNEAAHAVFYADGFKYAERIQAEDRNHRIGQQRRPTYVTLQCSDSIDDRIAKALARKENALQSFQAEVDACRTAGLKDRVLEMVRGL